MRELYSELTGSESGPVRFDLLSGFPSLGKHRVAKFLGTAGFPKARLKLRNWLLDHSLEDFKVGNASRILNARPDRPFIVIFDNSPPSYVMAHRLLGQFPRQLTGFYLHEVVQHTGSPMQGTEFYVTAYDIARKEWLKGHLSSEQAARVAEAIVDEPVFEYVIPGYAYCPKDYHPCGEVPMDDPQAVACRRLEEKIGTICASR
jgi:hypothetical protein